MVFIWTRIPRHLNCHYYNNMLDVLIILCKRVSNILSAISHGGRKVNLRSLFGCRLEIKSVLYICN